MFLNLENILGNLSTIIAKVLDCSFEFKCYYIHFQINTPWKGMKPLIPSAVD